MANKSLFSTRAPQVEQATTKNAAGGVAYDLTPKHALAQITATNCFNGTYYVDAENNLKIAKDAALKLKNDPLFIAQCAVYGRDKSYMKDMPAFLTVLLHDVCAGLPADHEHKTLFRRVFRRTIDNGKQLRNFISMARSGAVTGRKANMSSGSIRHALREWFAKRSPESIMKASIGDDPSIRDILRMARPRPENETKAALYAYLRDAQFDKDSGEYRVYKRTNPKSKNSELTLAHSHTWDSLPEIVKQYEKFKKDKTGPVPDVDFRLLDSLGLTDKQWGEIAANAPWQMTRMNLNTFERHGVFKDAALTQMIADRLRNPELVRKARAFPYQLMTAYLNATTVPMKVREALQDAVDIALENVPAINGKVVICVDVSGSMSSAITGSRGTVSSKMRCVDVASLFASALLRKNPEAVIMPFDTRIHACDLNPRDTVFTNAQKLARYGGGGTNCSLALSTLNSRRQKADAVIFVSDNESWVDSPYRGFYGTSGGTGMMTEWTSFKKHNKDSVLILNDLTPATNSQLKERPGILQIGGFSDTVFDVVAKFIESGSEGSDYWISEIEKVEI